MPRPRFKLGVRGMMAAVAVAAVLLWAGQVGGRWLSYGRLALAHEQVYRGTDAQVRTLRFYAEAHQSKGETVPDSLRNDIHERERIAEAEKELARMYQEAAWHPWRAIRVVDGPGSPR